MNQQVFETLLSEVCEFKYSTECAGLVVVRLFDTPTTCEWSDSSTRCVIESRKHKKQTTVRQDTHWRHKCVTCGAYVNSITGERAMLLPRQQHELRQFYECVKPKN